ncbi:MAG: polysaccharide pyruvyl transferase family protein [candidate division Zixibacteria bacterium]|nr:polysaccharide pyruvyl transferase family protein [candidate division Zixibacteria bacterium]
MRENLIIFGGAGFKNIGDDAMASSLKYLAEKYYPQDKVYILSSNRSLQKLGPKFYPSLKTPKTWREWAHFLQLMLKTKRVVIGGGGLLHDLTPNFYRPFARLALLSRLLGAKPIFFGVGVYKPTTLKFKIFLKILNFLRIGVVTRDEESEKVLKKIGSQHLFTSYDPAFVFSRIYDSKPDGLEISQLNKTEPVLGVSLRSLPPRLRLCPEHKENIFKKIALALDQIIDQLNSSVLFFPFSSGYQEKDEDCHNFILDNMRHSNRCESLKFSDNPGDVWFRLKEVDLYVGMRLHSVIFAASSGIPTVALAYERKIYNVAQQLKIEKVIDPLNFEPQALSESILYVWKNRKDISIRLKQTSKDFAQKVMEDWGRLVMHGDFSFTRRKGDD